ncbi:MAG: ABC transporter ATP-binding protein [Parcubacteria group bacterium]|jgi:branched-chain amino acid transport system ATP-binding protein|nr:ABC transporter ATP-binding protein [Parcubacteria group bacterium]|tara:strand:- start:5119 stop:5826 length:708 start_codon:yes stop_codon:yes gene_type:complete
MFLSIKNLHVNYESLEVLKGVSLDIEKGDINVLLGANGSGKSTMFKAISGILRPAKGEIFFQDTKINKLQAHAIVKKGIAQAPEGKRLFIDMTVEENLEMGAYLRTDKREIEADREDIMDRFPVLRKKLKVISGNLSGGEQQMLVIARSLMSKPQLLLLDEPAQGLSPVLVDEVADIITGINQSGITIILIEHNLRLGLGLAHWVFVLESGVIATKAKGTDMSEVEYAKKIYLGG